MSNNGVLAIIVNIDTKNKELLNTPIVTTRGFVLVNESTELIKEIELSAKRIVEHKLKAKNANFMAISYLISFQNENRIL